MKFSVGIIEYRSGSSDAIWPLPSDGWAEKFHGGPSIWPRPKFWTRDQRWSDISEKSELDLALRDHSLCKKTYPLFLSWTKDKRMVWQRRRDDSS